MNNEEIAIRLRELRTKQPPAIFGGEDSLEFRWVFGDGIVYDLEVNPISFYQYDQNTEKLTELIDPPPAVIDADHLDAQRRWSEKTFGPGRRTNGVLDHIRKELKEIEADPDDLIEWADVIILAFDGAWRHGWEPQQIIDAIKEKQATNEKRVWPDWRTRSEDVAIEHDRSGE